MDVHIDDSVGGAMRVSGRTVLGLLVTFLVVAGPVAAAPTVTLFATEPSLTSNRAIIEVGIAQGIFEKYGLRLQLSAAESGQAAVRRADAGAFIGASGVSVLCQTTARGARLKALFVTLGDATGRAFSNGFIAVVAGRTSGIRAGHVEDLRGKRVGLTRLTDAHTYYWYLLTAAGLDPVSAATIVDTPPPALPKVLQNGTVDAIVGWEPIVAQALRAAPGSILVRRGGPEYWFEQLRSVSTDYLATHPGTIKRYVTAFVEASQYVRRHREAAAAALLADFRNLDLTDLQAGVAAMSPDPRVSKVTRRSWQAGCDFAVKAGAVARTPAFEDVFDVRILRQVERDRPDLFSDLPPIPESERL